MSDITTRDLTEVEARSLTEEVKRDATALWAKLLTLYEGNAHIALGYTSWGAYYQAEFSEDQSRGYRLLDAARIDRALIDSPIGERPISESVARELAPVLRNEGPEAVEEVWGEVVSNGKPTAAAVADAVAARRNDPMDPPPPVQPPLRPDQIRPSTLAELPVSVPPPETPPVDRLPDPRAAEEVQELLNAWRVIREAVNAAWERERSLRFDHELDDRLDGLLQTTREQTERAVRGID